MAKSFEDLKIELEQQFRTEIHSIAEKIDPDNELDWYSLTVGWALAKGLKPTMAQKFSSYIRYDTDLG